jgi:PIN domain nuclease of toxin-antitoxin system
VAPLVRRLAELGEERGTRIAALTADICLAATLDWEHRDPFDRIIAATCIVQRLALVSADPAFDGVAYPAGPLMRIW